MEKIKLTKGELKKQRDALTQYKRYLPTLQLKKQQLQMEILGQVALLKEKTKEASAKREAMKVWAGLLIDSDIEIHPWVVPREVIVTSRNIAGVDFPVFDRTEFDFPEYDLFSAPLWMDAGIELLRGLAALREEIKVIERGIEVLKEELRITTQRVNLFEKVKIPQAQEAIRLIKIYIGDQMTNAVGRSKVAKKKIEEAISLDEVRL